MLNAILIGLGVIIAFFAGYFCGGLKRMEARPTFRARRREAQQKRWH